MQFRVPFKSTLAYSTQTVGNISDRKFDELKHLYPKRNSTYIHAQKEGKGKVRFSLCENA